MKYLPILLIACFLNYRQRKALLLTLIVGWGATLPIPQEIGAMWWYSSCALIEALILISAISLKVQFSKPIIVLSVLYIGIHYLGWTFDGYIAGSPYCYFSRTVAFTELFVCALLSQPVINFVKGKLR